MPLLFENTDRAMRKFSPFKFNPDIGSTIGIFAVGVLTGLIVVPVLAPIVGYQLTKRFGEPSYPPPPPRR